MTHVYKVIAPFNVYLGDDNVVETIGMGSILIKVMVKDKMKRTCIKDNFPCVQVASTIDHDEQILVKWVKIQLNLNESIVKGLGKKVNVMGLHQFGKNKVY